MSNRVIISILITTYNRVAFLETTVYRFISQIIGSGLDDRIEIIIGNDASSDGTEVFLNQLQEKYRFIKVINHSKNLGFSENVEKIVAEARGEYIWHFGDDDLITDNAVKRVLEVITNNDPNYILLNTINIESLDNRNLNYKIIGDKRLNINEDVFIKNFEAETDKLLKIQNWLYLTNLLSSVACKKKLYLDCMDSAKQYARKDNLYMWQIAIIIGISKLGRLYIVAEQLILHRKNENNWSGSVHKILKLNLYDSSDVSRVIKKYMPREYKEYQKRFASFVFATILQAKNDGGGVNKYIIDALKRNYNCYPYNLRFLAVLFFPRIVLRTYIKYLN